MGDGTWTLFGRVLDLPSIEDMNTPRILTLTGLTIEDIDLGAMREHGVT